MAGEVDFVKLDTVASLFYPSLPALGLDTLIDHSVGRILTTASRMDPSPYQREGPVKGFQDQWCSPKPLANSGNEKSRQTDQITALSVRLL